MTSPDSSTPEISKPEWAGGEISKMGRHASVAQLTSAGWEWALPAVMMAVLIGLTVLTWHLQRVESRAIAESEASADAARLADRAQHLLNAGTMPLRRRWHAGHLTTQDDFVADVKASNLLGPSVLMIGWVDDQGILRQNEGKLWTRPVPWKLDDHWMSLITVSRQAHGGTCIARVDPQMGSVIEGALPGTAGHPMPDIGGAIIFEYRVAPLLAGLLDSSSEGRFVLELSEGDITLYRAPDVATKPADVAAIDLPAMPVRLMDHVWQFHVTPTEEYIRGHVANTPHWALWTWLMGMVLLIASISQAIHYRKRYASRLEHHLQALEKLAETSAAILNRVDGTSEVWQRVPEAASLLLSMGMASVAVLEEDEKSLRIVASFGVDPPTIGHRFLLSEMPSATKCIQTRQPVAHENIKNIRPNAANRELAERYQIRSALQVPLKRGEKVIGLIMLAHRQPRKFTASDVRLAELWGMLSAVAIGNDRLYEQTVQAIAARDRLLEQREAIFSIVNELVTLKGSTEQILERIVELAPAPLQVDVCQVSLLTENPNELIVAAFTRAFGQDVVGYRYPFDGSGSGRALRQNSIWITEEGGPDHPQLNPFLRTHVPCGSAAFVPMKGAGGEAIGLLILLRKKPGAFSEDQISMSQLLAVRAASAIENARLYQRTREDADAKTMLLRELNHRVKNNLAGIVALLSIDQPELSPRARQWLNRVIDRVRNLSRTQEMLTAGFGPVTLRELIGHTLKSLSVIVRPEMKVEIEVKQSDVRLRTDRAVSLAMVLHELCYNAMVHGLSESGNLRVKATAQSPHDLVVEVIDDGCGFIFAPDDENGWDGPSRTSKTEGASSAASPVAVASQTRSGAGLNLVRDFVGRELRGKFSVISAPGQGTTARVEFPLLADEWTGRQEI